MWWGCYGLRLSHKPSELAHSFLFCSYVYCYLYGPFNCISCHKFSRQLSVFSLSSLELISALLVLSTICLFMKVSVSPDIIPRGWLGSKHRLTKKFLLPTFLIMAVSVFPHLYGALNSNPPPQFVGTLRYRNIELFTDYSVMTTDICGNIELLDYTAVRLSGLWEHRAVGLCSCGNIVLWDFAVLGR